LQKNIAITGATGLLGSHLSNSLILKGHNVYVLIKDENSKSILSKKVNRIYGDISSKANLEYFIQKVSPDYFIHLAAQTQAYDSLRYPYQTFYNNIVGTMNVLECLREFSQCKSIVIASSDKAYGELVGNFYLEDHQLKGVYPYDASKSATDIIANSYRITYGMPIAITRACNIYGIGDYNPRRLIPATVLAYLKKQTFIIRNKGTDLREYIHVSDVVSAYESILEHVENENKIPAFNISSGDRYTTYELFCLIQNILKDKIDFKVIDEDSHEIKKQFMDSSLLKKITGWDPKITIADSLQETVEWYIENL
jgi:CDP-glucose 4,6-dehydratase